MKYEREPYEQVDWNQLDSFGDRTFSQLRGWLDFVCETQAGKPVIARLHESGTTIGFFSGVLIRRLGVNILGSPFPGWSTPYMGLNVHPDVPRSEAIAALLPFVFQELNCHHLEIADPFLKLEEMSKLGFQVREGRTFRSDLTMSEDDLLARMDSACRRCIRKSLKSGVSIEEAAPEGFAGEYYSQLKDVFAKRNMNPTYSEQRVDALVRHFHPSGNLLLLRARDAAGRGIATGIYPGFNTISLFWGNASFREHQIVRPNEPLHWHAMRYWKHRGIKWHYWGNGGDYKRKYGGEEIPFMEFRMSRGTTIALARDTAKTLYYFGRQIRSQVINLTRSYLPT